MTEQPVAYPGKGEGLLCSCESCLEMRMWREVHPNMKVTALEQFHNVGEGGRLLRSALVRELARMGAALGRVAARCRGWLS
jgi:hypothetical protein